MRFLVGLIVEEERRVAFFGLRGVFYGEWGVLSFSERMLRLEKMSSMREEPVSVSMQQVRGWREYLGSLMRCVLMVPWARMMEMRLRMVTSAKFGRME